VSRRSFGLFVLAGVAACVSPDFEVDGELQALSSNLIANGSFEDGSVAWRTNNWGTNTSRFSLVNDASAGARAARVDVSAYTSGDAKWIFDAVSVTAGTTYVYRDAYKSDTTSRLVAAMQLSDGSTVYSTFATLPPSSTWTTANAPLTTAANCVRLSVYHLIASAGYLQLDDARLGLPDAAVVEGGVTNGTLEQASDLDLSRPAGWRSERWGTNTASFVYDTDAHGGSRSVRVTVSSYSSGDAKWYFEPVALTPGNTYVYRDFYKSTAPTKLVAAITQANGSLAYQTLVASVPASSTWTALTANFVVPTGAARVTFYHLIAAAGTLQLDDVSLLPPVTLDLSSGVPNGSFEQLQDRDPTKPLAWQTSASSTLTATFTHRSDGRTGTRSAGLNVNNYVSGDAKWFFDPQPVSPGTRYLYSDYSISSVPSYVTARFTRTDGSFVYAGLGSVPASTTYTPARFVFVAPENATRATVFHRLASNGTLIIDDVALVPQPAAAIVDGVPNGNLEQAAYEGASEPIGFRTNAWGTHNATFTWDTDAHAGNRSAKVAISTYTSGNAGWYFDAQPVDATRVYDFADWYRADVETLIDATITLANGTVTYIRLPSAAPASTWTRYRARLYLPDNARSVTVLHGLARVGSLSVDDVSFIGRTPAPFNRALVSLAFDDSWLSDYNLALPVLSQHAVPATHFVITNAIGTTNRLDLTLLTELHNRGHEIASHTASHADLTTLAPSALLGELTTSKQYLEANGFGPVLDFASPQGQYNPAVVDAIRTLYQSHRTVDAGFNAQDDLDPYRLRCQNIRNTTTAAEVATWAARAAAERSWLILTYHDVVSSGGSQYSTTTARLDEQISALQNQSLAIVTVQQALSELLPQLQSSAP
jgi:peptidoglycan/xylan/chitin deacetylase (PgdA/CDA1 family)